MQRVVINKSQNDANMQGPVYRIDIKVPAQLVDGNGHVNNVAYVRWMQDAAVDHSNATGCTEASSALGATWVVRAHRIEYLRPAFAGDIIIVLTWVANFRKVHSLRKYKFIRQADSVLLAEAETDWVFVNAKSGRPMAIPDSIKNAFQIVCRGNEP